MKLNFIKLLIKILTFGKVWLLKKENNYKNKHYLVKMYFGRKVVMKSLMIKLKMTYIILKI